MKYLLIIMLAASCNAITPDRFGIGVSEGSMNAFGKSNKFMNNQPNQMEMDLRGDTDSTMIWLEWDLPSFREPTDYDAYLRDRVRTLNLERELLQKTQVIDKVIKDIDKATQHKPIAPEPTTEDCLILERSHLDIWPLKLTQQYYL